MKSCPHCGCLHTDKAGECRGCGKQFTEASPGVKFPTPLQSTLLKYILCIGIGVFVELLAFSAAIAATFTGCGSAPLPPVFSFILPFIALVPKAVANSPIAMTIGFSEIFQMPVYGAILARGWTTGRFKKYAFWLACVHFTAGVIGCIIQSL